MRTIAQKRAEYALEQVLKIPKITDDFRSFSASAPSMILQNGFGQTMAFWYQKGSKKDKVRKDIIVDTDDKHIRLLNIVKNWLSLKNGDINNKYIKKTEEIKIFLAELSKMEQQDYLAAQEETLRLLEWVKRYANAGLNNV